jgi:hypothetical protein
MYRNQAVPKKLEAIFSSSTKTRTILPFAARRIGDETGKTAARTCAHPGTSGLGMVDRCLLIRF